MCQMEKNKNVSSKVPLKVFNIPEKPFEMISMDFIGPLPESASYNTVLVMINKFTKYVIVMRRSTDDTQSLTSFATDESDNEVALFLSSISTT